MTITIVIPVGPYTANTTWLDECIESCLYQTMPPDEILLIDDGANLRQWNPNKFIPHNYYASSRYNASYQAEIVLWNIFNIHVMPWRTGITTAFNYGVMLARNECVFMLGSDDTLEPSCLEDCWTAYLQTGKADYYYSVPLRYMDTGEIQTTPCNAAMTTKGFWRLSGGFPVESSMGAGDAALLSICMVNSNVLPVYCVGSPDKPLYNYRRHPDTHTGKLSNKWPIVNELRNLLTEEWSAEDVASWAYKYG